MRHRIHLELGQATASLGSPIVRAARAALEHEDAPEGRLAVVLADEDTVRELNRRYAGIDEATDVLSFPDGSRDPSDGLTYFGDILIALPLAERQALEGGISLTEELQVLVVHGVLHLLGHDHADPKGKRQMWAAQEACLKSLDVSPKAWKTL